MDAELITQGTLQTRAGRALPLQRTEVRATVTGPVAEVEVRQVFRNDTDTAIEAVYLFPLPHDASVHRMLFRIEDRVVQGVVKDKAEARRTYEKARAEGRAATLLEEERPALFTLSVANVAPGATIEVELGYQELVAYDDGRWRFVFPLVAPERYRDPPPAAAGALAPPRMPTGQRAGDVSLEVLVRGEGHVESLRSPTHPVTARYTDDGVPVVSMLPGDTLPNRDFVLTWQAGDTGVRPALRFERHPGQTGTFLLVVTPSVPKDLTERTGGAGDLKALKCGNCGGAVTDLASIREIPGLGPVVPCGYCGAILSPGTEVITRARRPRDVLVLVDRSASMRATLPTVGRAVRALLDALAPGDAAQLMAFDHDRVAFDNDGSRFAVVSPELITQAERFLSELRPRGGTELEAALARAAALPPRDGRTRVVVAITDAAVGNTGRLLRRVPELLGPSTRLFVLGAGPAVDRRLVASLARAGGGASDVIDPGARGDDLDDTLRRFARRVREGGPVLTNLTLYWQGATMVEMYPKALPDLFGGEPLRLLGRFDAAGPTKLILTAATSDGRPFRQELDVVLPTHTPTAPGLGRLWARRHVEALAARADAEPSVAAALREEATALSIAHRIVGPFTSLVAEDLTVSVKPRTVRKGVLQVVAGPVVLPPFVLDRPKVRVGRVSTADLQLTDPKVSREHCEVVLEGDDWVIRDAHSVNGIEVDGKMVRRAVLQPGSRVVLGGCTLRFDRLDDTFTVAPAQRVDVEGPAAAADAGPAPQAGGPGKGRAKPEASSALADDEADFELDAMLGEGGGDYLGSREGAEASASSAPEARKRASTTGAPPPPAAFDAPPPAPRPAPVPMFAPAPMAAPGGPPPSAPGMPTSAPMSAPLGSAAPVSGMFGAMPPALAPIPAPAEAGGGFFSRVAQSLRGARSEEAPSPPSPPPVVPPPILWPIDPLAPPPTPFVPASPVLHVMPMPFAMPTASPPPRPPEPLAMPACPKCTEVLSPDVRFCLRCGHDLRGGVPYTPPLPPPPVAPPRRPLLPPSDPYNAAELAWFAARGRGELDLVFLVDETGSMGAYIDEVRTHLRALVTELQASPLCRLLRLGVVTYRDHPPQDHTYASRVVPLTDDIARVQREVDGLRASGGGDGPESVTDGLYDLVRLDWRPNAARAVVWFGDAPPHGVEPHGDAFPDGCPCGHHWFTQAESCQEMGVTVYAVGCLPGLRAFKGAEAVFKQVAETTRGMYLPLRQASLLVPLIVGAASAELDRQRLDEHLVDAISAGGDALAATTEPERVAWLCRALTARGVRPRTMDFDPDELAPAPMRFRPVTPEDVVASLGRLRFQGRVTV